jgi:hypothetical protein
MSSVPSSGYGAIPIPAATSTATAKKQLQVDESEDDDYDSWRPIGDDRVSRKKMVAIAAMASMIVIVGALLIVSSSTAHFSSTKSFFSLRQSSSTTTPTTTTATLPTIDDDGRHHLSQDTWTPLWYKQQTVNHLNHPHDKRTFAQKYFENDSYFGGPGSPIFVVLGGEDPMTDLIIPFVYINMAQTYKAATIGIEHRYFGDSYPVKHYTNEDLQQLLTPRQATEDFVQLIQWYRQSKNCNLDKDSLDYCPVITVGGSYPGFLSAMMRLDYPHVVDIAYASSAPLNLYGHDHVDPFAYYDYVTKVADDAVPGCKDAVRTSLYDLHDSVLSVSASGDTHAAVLDLAKTLRICPKHGIPEYILKNDDPIHMFWTEVNAIIVSHFAEANMGYYPPGPDTELEQACRIFMAPNTTMPQRVGNFLTMRPEWQETQCFDMHSELPARSKHNATISSSDWSGMGDGENALMWEFLSCQLLPPLSQGPNSMFYPREWSESWVSNKCQARFDFTPDFHALEKDFGFDDLRGVSHLLFVNGIRDGWSLMSITVPPPDSEIVVINVPNGAHCRDFYGPGTLDTPDMVQAHVDIETTIGTWLAEIELKKRTRSSSRHHRE